MAAEDWLRRRTFHHRDFADLQKLVAEKNAQNLTVSACIPALNEGSTIGPIVRTIREELGERVPLIDEVVVVDSRSQDHTVEEAEKAGAVVVQDHDILPGLEPYAGKGEAMWKSLFVLKGDLIVWLDGDIENFHPRLVYGPLGPLLTHPDIVYAKAFYERALQVGGKSRPGEGGRVTELMARPLLNMFWPELGGIAQPLSGEYAGRRSALEQVPFLTGYGVEIGLIIDIAERFGLDAIGQVDLETREHRNRSVKELSRMSSAVLQAAFLRLASTKKLKLKSDVSRLLHQFSRNGESYRLERTEIDIRERPPASTIPEYHTR